MTAEECRELAVLWQRYGVTYADYTRSLSADQADVMLRAFDEQGREPGTSAFAEPPDLGI